MRKRRTTHGLELLPGFFFAPQLGDSRGRNLVTPIRSHTDNDVITAINISAIHVSIIPVAPVTRLILKQI